MLAAQEFTEYCAALTASAVYNVHRKKDSKFLTPDALMLRAQQRKRLAPPVDAPPRYARSGEKPPSLRPGVSAIDRFDAYAKQMKGRKARG